MLLIRYRACHQHESNLCTVLQIEGIVGNDAQHFTKLVMIVIVTT